MEMKFATSEDIRSIDEYCISKLKIPETILMENAGIKVIKNLNLKDNASFVLICGAGNNGGDGFVVARHLFALNKKVKVFFIGNKDKMTESTKANYNILKNIGVKVTSSISAENIEEVKSAVIGCDVVIDAIFGTGLKREITGIFKLMISMINENAKYIVAIDVPSGLQADTGEVMGTSIISNKTITFALYKKGFFSYESIKYTGEIITEQIGIPEEVINKFVPRQLILTEEFARQNIKNRGKYEHKGNFGRVLVLAGSYDYAGAAYICTEGAVKAGAGLVTLCSSKDTIAALRGKITEAMTAFLENKEKLTELINKANVIALGPGMGNNDETLKITKEIINKASCKIVIDADGINVISRDLSVLEGKHNEIVLTPHLGEMERLTGIPVKDIEQNRIDVAKNFASKYGVTVLLKGYYTVITNGEDVFINSTGNSAMASGGMGDCLTGIIAALIGSGMKAPIAAAVGAYIHGAAGDKLSEEMYSITAGELLKKIPYIMKEIIK